MGRAVAPLGGRGASWGRGRGGEDSSVAALRAMDAFWAEVELGGTECTTAPCETGESSELGYDAALRDEATPRHADLTGVMIRSRKIRGVKERCGGVRSREDVRLFRRELDLFLARRGRWLRAASRRRGRRAECPSSRRRGASSTRVGERESWTREKGDARANFGFRSSLRLFLRSCFPVPVLSAVRIAATSDAVGRNCAEGWRTHCERVGSGRTLARRPRTPSSPVRAPRTPPASPPSRPNRSRSPSSSRSAAD